MEEWRDIPGCPGYQASDLGRVRSCRKKGYGLSKGLGKWHIMTPHDHSYQLSVGLRFNKRRRQVGVGRLVLEAFVGPCPEGMECCHNDGDRLNNHLENLRWDTHTANVEDSRKHGTMTRGEASPNAKLTDEKVKEIRSLHTRGYCMSDLVSVYNVSRSTIQAVVEGRVWKHVK